LFKLTIQGTGFTFSVDITKTEALTHIRSQIAKQDGVMAQEPTKPTLVEPVIADKPDGEPP
jgi:hypothetical protein